MKKTNKLTRSERVTIYKMHRLHESIRSISRELGRSHTTVLREVKRNGAVMKLSQYSDEQASLAQGLSEMRKSAASKKRGRLKNETIRHYVRLHLCEPAYSWSPEIISGRLSELGYPISHEAIYQWIYAEEPELVKYLLVVGKCRRRRMGGRRSRKPRPVALTKRSIEQLPDSSRYRQKIGHAELDAIVGSQGSGGPVIQNLVDRKARRVMLTKVESLKSEEYSAALLSTVKERWQGPLSTILEDNGGENAQHKAIDEALGTESYFTRPYCSCEKGTVENRNKIVRIFLPKGTNFSCVSQEKLLEVENHINTRPMKVLQYKTPNEVWRREVEYLAQFKKYTQLSLPLIIA